MKLYYSRGACSLAVRILINELAIPCEYEAVNLATTQTEKGSDFYSINPKGAVPTLVLDTGEVLTENAVIHQYLANTYNATSLLPPVSDFNHYRVLEWLNFITTDLHKSFVPLFNSQVPEELKTTIFKPSLLKKFMFVEKALENKKYLMGGQFTLADGYLFVVLRWFHFFKFDMTVLPNIVSYFNTMKERASVKKSLQEEGI